MREAPLSGKRSQISASDWFLSNAAQPSRSRCDETLPQTWGIIIGKTLTDPVWFFITDWFAVYLVSKGHRLEESLLAFWIPFLAADVGNFAGGGLSSWLINRGWSVGASRKLVVVASGLGMTLLIPTVFTSSYFWLVACFAMSTLAYAAFSTMRQASWRIATRSSRSSSPPA
jgi:ACS family hexuronate transporter-like MFS transporter